MSWLYFLGARGFKSFRAHCDDNWVDKLHYYYTSTILIICAVAVTAKQYVGAPIQCWVPATYTESMEEYAENYCYIQNTYFFPMHLKIPRSIKNREQQQIGYYQWVPFILIMEAFTFCIPCIIWRVLYKSTGLQLRAIVEMAAEARFQDNIQRKKSIKIITGHIWDIFTISKNEKARDDLASLRPCRINYGFYICLLYQVIKCLYFINALMQTIFLNMFLDTQYPLYGLQIFLDLLNGQEWQSSGHFPRVTLCDFEVRELGNIHRHTIQCVLCVNMFNEKIFVFLWFWFFFLMLCTGVDFFHQMYECFNQHLHLKVITGYLHVSGTVSDIVDVDTVRKFVHLFLRQDGCFLLRLIETNAGQLICTELTSSLFMAFSKESPLFEEPDFHANRMASKPGFKARFRARTGSLDKIHKLKENGYVLSFD